MPMLTHCCTARDAGSARRGFALVTLVLIVVVLASSACGVSTAASSTPTDASSPTVDPTATITSVPLPTEGPAPTNTPAPEWVTYTTGLDATSRTYQIDIPGVLICGRSSGPPQHSILPCDMQGQPLPPDHPLAAEVNISLDAAWVTDGMYNCRSGTRISVGPGITGYQTYGFSVTPTPGGCSSGSYVNAFWIAHGVCYDLIMGGQPPNDTFMSRYGAIWKHMLASFKPAPAESGGTTCS